MIIRAKLTSVSLHRDLSLLTTDVLSWNFHIANITAKANSILGLIKRTCRDVNDVTTLKALYCIVGESGWFSGHQPCLPPL